MANGDSCADQSEERFAHSHQTSPKDLLFGFRKHGLNVDALLFFNATEEAQLDPLMNDKRVLGGKYQRI